jgi:DNA-directed RNA polymerase subunit F
VSEVDQALRRAEELLDRLGARREELERLASVEDLDGEAAVELVSELAELAKEIEAELTRARAIADASG